MHFSPPSLLLPYSQKVKIGKRSIIILHYEYIKDKLEKIEHQAPLINYYPFNLILFLKRQK
jgi:hypothetical protein